VGYHVTFFQCHVLLLLDITDWIRFRLFVQLHIQVSAQHGFCILVRFAILHAGLSPALTVTNISDLQTRSTAGSANQDVNLQKPILFGTLFGRFLNTAHTLPTFSMPAETFLLFILIACWACLRLLHT